MPKQSRQQKKLQKKVETLEKELQNYKTTCQQQLFIIDQLKSDNKNLTKITNQIHYLKHKNQELEITKFNNAINLGIETIKNWPVRNGADKLLKEWITYAHEVEQKAQDMTAIRKQAEKENKDNNELREEIKKLKKEIENCKQYEDVYIDLDLKLSDSKLSEFHEDIDLCLNEVDSYDEAVDYAHASFN